MEKATTAATKKGVVQQKNKKKLKAYLRKIKRGS